MKCNEMSAQSLHLYYLIDDQYTADTPLISHTFYARGCMPQYSPDSLNLVLVYGGIHDIYIGTPDGNRKTVFEDSIPGRPHCYFPRWSTDGKYIVFAASPSADRRISDYEIYIKPVKGGEAVRLTFNPTTDT